MKERMTSTDHVYEIVEFLRATPDKAGELTMGLSDDDLRRRNSTAEFSALENVCHLGDIEAEGYTARINRILSEEQPFLPDIDGGRLAIERDYNGQRLLEAQRAFANARAENVRILENLMPEQLSRAGLLEGTGTITLEQLLVLMREHDEGHLNDLRIICDRVRADVGSTGR
jgi:hypothetical protein